MKILILGRGFAGLSFAREIQQLGHDAIVIGNPLGIHRSTSHPEKRTFEGHAAASRAAVGISSLKGHFLPQTRMFEEKIRGHEGLGKWLAQISADSGIPIPFFRGPIFEAYFSSKEFEHLHERIFHSNFHGFYKNHLLEASEFLQLFAGRKSLMASPLGAFQFYDDLWFDPSQCLNSLESAIIKNGGIIITGSFQHLIFKDKNPLDTISPGRLTSFVDTSDYPGSQPLSLNHDHLVIACGSSTNDILNLLECPTINLSLCTGVTTVSSSHQTSSTPPWFLRYKKTNIVGLKEALIYGSTSLNKNLPGLKSLPPSSINDDIICSDLKNDLEISNLIGRPRVTEHLWGARVRTKDRSPVLGNLAMLYNSKTGSQFRSYPHFVLNNIWIMTGFYKNGLQLSWIFAQKLAQALLKNAPEVIEKDFSLSRLIT